MNKKNLTLTIIFIALVLVLIIKNVVDFGSKEVKCEATSTEVYLIGSYPHYHFNVCETILAEITGYNPVVEQTDSTPDIMASGKRVYKGAIACPRRIPLGSTVVINGENYCCEDRTAEKHDGRFDILFFGLEEAKDWGLQVLEITVCY